ncbi:MAG TPA: hypothetical protein VFS97_06530 [Nitrososphaeraceae archaeon]|nr:hypothetical protein [Nitrososphaeraceae archaeon]
MNKNECTAILPTIAITSLLATAFVLVGSINLSQKATGQAEEVFGENATFTQEVEGTGAITNQTAAPPTNQTAAPPTNQTAAPPTNQTAAPPTNQTAAPPTNLTRSDIEPIRDSLETAREALQDDREQAALEALNNADGALFAIITYPQPKEPVYDQLSTLRDNIDTARDSLHGNDAVKALQDLNAADSQVLTITKLLPAEEEGEEEGE